MSEQQNSKVTWDPAVPGFEPMDVEIASNPMIRAATSGAGGVPEDVAEMTLAEAAQQHPAGPVLSPEEIATDLSEYRPAPVTIDLPRPQEGSWQPMDVEVVSDEEYARLLEQEPLGQIVFDVTQTRADFLPTQGVHDGIHRTAEMT